MWASYSTVEHGAQVRDEDAKCLTYEASAISGTSTHNKDRQGRGDCCIGTDRTSLVIGGEWYF